MESGSGDASDKGFLIPVSDSLDVFQSSILAPLQNAYLYEESKQFFRYKSAFLVKNPELEEKYNTFRAKKRNAGYSENELKESYGFLLFDDGSKANALGVTGLLTGNSTCTTLGDPLKGVYISMYSDCLDLNRWYHGKSGYIAIIKLTKGKVQNVAENYTQNYTEPTVGFDCHVSEHLPSVSAKTSSFLAFERTQYYVYELLDDGSNGTAQCPSAACPFAIVSFSYTDTKETLSVPEERSEVKKLACHYLLWTGQLQIDGQTYAVKLKPVVGASIPAKLPSVVKVNKIISMSDLRRLLPRAIFETSYSDEVFHDGFYCSLCEFVPSELEETSSFAQLLWEIKERDLAFAIPLNDSGFLILLHSSHFLTYDDASSSAAEVLQGIFVFPDSRVVRGDTKFGKRNSGMPSEVLQVLPVLSYVEAEIEKTPMDSSEELCDVLTQHMQRFATLINPGLPISPSREVSIFPDQYDIADAHKHLYSLPEWATRRWQSLKSYLNKPASFQLPLSKVSEILIAGQEERREDLVDDVYICLSSPEEAPARPVSTELDNQICNQQSPVNVETSVDIGISSVEPQVDLLCASQNVVQDNLRVGGFTKDEDKCIDPTDLNKSDDAGAKSCLSPTSEDLPTELIVSITSAERTDIDGISVVSTVSTPKHNDLQFCGLPIRAKLQTADLNSFSDETDQTKKVLDSSKATNLRGTKKRKWRRGRSKAQKKAPRARAEPHSLQSVSTPVEVVSLNCNTDDYGEELDQSHLSNPPERNWRKFQRRKRRFGKLSSKSKKVKSVTVASAEVKESDPRKQTLENTVLMELEALPLKKKTERWDLKPVISNCGRILVPHGSIDTSEQVKSLKIKLQALIDQGLKKMLNESPVNDPVTFKMEEEARTTSEMAIDETGATKPTDGGNRIQSVLPADSDKSILRPSEHTEGSVPLTLENNATSSKDDDMDTTQPPAVLEKRVENFSSRKGENLLSRLKSALSRRKRKPDFHVTVEKTENTAQDGEVCLKKAKGDFDIEQVMCSNGTTQTTNGSVKVSKMPSVDPVFAYALGLTPRNNPDEGQKTEDQAAQQTKDLETKEPISLEKQHQIIQKPLPIFPKGIRIKTLKKHQGISAENIKKKCTPFQVPPLYGSTRLLHHHQIMHGDGVQTLHPSVIYEDISEHTRTSDYLHRHKRHFKHSRTFVMKDGSIQVTKQWQENYDFNLDSRFTSDPKDKVVIRALHGPWDYSIRDTGEEVRLIFHIWIGLFYSRSTARFFQADSSFMHLCSEGNDSLLMASGLELGLGIPEPRANTSASFPSETNTSVPLVSKAMGLSINNNTVVEPEPVVLDLSLKNSNAEPSISNPQVNLKVSSVSNEPTEHVETIEALKVPKERQEANTFQCEKKIVDSSETLSEVNDVRNIQESIKNDHHQTAVCSDHTGYPSYEDDRSVFPLQEEMPSVPFEPGADQEVLDIGPVLDGCNQDFTLMTDGTEHSDSTGKSLVEKDGRDLSKSLTEVDFSTKENDVVYSDKNDYPKSKVHKSHAMTNNQCLEDHIDPSPEVIHTDNDSANKESDICSRNFLENKKLLSQEECQAVSPDQTDHLNGAVNCTSSEGTQLEDDHLRENGLVKKESSISADEVDSVLKNQPLPKMCDSPVKDNCFSEYSHQAKKVELLPPENTENEACESLCVDPNSLKDQSPISDAPDTPSELVPGESESKENLENIHQVDKPLFEKPALPKSDESLTSFDSSQIGLSSPQTKDSAEMRNEKQVSDFNSDPNSIKNAGQETKSSEREENTEKATEKELLIDQSDSPKSKVINSHENDLSFTKETDLKKDAINEALNNSWGRVVTPFTGVDTSGVHVVQPQDDVLEAVKGQEAIPFIGETTSPVTVQPNEVCSTSQICGKEAEQSSLKIPLLDLNETHELRSMFDSSCPTPTIDERPLEYMSYSSPSSSTHADITQKCPSRSSMPVRDELPCEQKLQPSTFNTNQSLNQGLDPDLELRTLRVLQSIKYIAISKHMNISSQIETNIKKKSLDQKCRRKSIPTSLASSKTPNDLKNKKINDKKTVNSQDRHPKPSDNIPSLSCELEKVLDVELLLKNTNSSIPPHHLGSADQLEISVGTNCHLSRSFVSTQGLQEEHKTSQSSIILHNEYRPYSQRPVMAVKPSKSDESQAPCFSKDVDVKTNSRSKLTNDVKVKHSTSSFKLLEMKDNSEGNSDAINCNQDPRELSSKNTWLSNVSCSKSNTDGSRYALLESPQQYQGRSFSKSLSSHPSKQPFESAVSCPEFVSGKQAFLRYSLNETVEHTAEEMKEEESSDKSYMYHKDDGISKDGHILGPRSSLVCTVFNNNEQRSCTLLEQLSRRCIQDDLTQASLEQESLIFSEQIKNLLKKNTRGPTCQQNTHVKCTSPMTVNFCCLEEQEDSLDFLDTSLVGQIIKVDMSDRKDLANATEEDKLLQPQDAGNPMEHAGISGVTAECAKLYEAKMHDVCSVKKTPYRHKGWRVDRVHPKTQPNNPFDFCGQMKKELDETFRTNLNAVVKKSCKTKYRFHILMTSDDAFFEETKAHLEAAGHTAVQPAEFFIGQDNSSSLFIILRNEDIEEHICKIPHLLQLKMSPGVQFAGIDEPDDVVNLTHQELFTRGGYIMFDRAVLEPFSLCNMKKISEILQELSRKGKWRWMLHYRDSRHLKENARLSAKANEKKHFLHWGQDAGILEVLPYHECDLMSKDQPDYLTCLLRLQVQNISSRHTVFITDTTDSAFEKNGILTMTLNTFLTKTLSETFTV
ncbi:protein TASOR 2 isoform X2 [Melanotaenia boesemani]|uniref:protein TASOR 2 isoform X2 n=1 Tax=Melanotaenia boesemani TaxID=1250792 RepID=UPI001C05223D|nr:protein TASOR 2 isoform X2 [Melanotaenia boesemani]